MMMNYQPNTMATGSQQSVAGVSSNAQEVDLLEKAHKVMERLKDACMKIGIISECLTGDNLSVPECNTGSVPMSLDAKLSDCGWTLNEIERRVIFLEVKLGIGSNKLGQGR